MKIRELMTRKVETFTPDTTLATAAEALWRKDCGVIVVATRSGEIMGVATDRDMFIALGTRDRLPSELTLRDVMTRNPVTCYADEDVRRALEKMRVAKVRRLPVTDAHGRATGIISLDDIARCAAPGGTGEPCESDVVDALKSVCEQPPHVAAAVARRCARDARVTRAARGSGSARDAGRSRRPTRGSSG
jgi:CBS domain-containing protein